MTSQTSKPFPRAGNGRKLGIFVLTGGFAAGVNLLIRWCCNLVMPYVPAIAIGYLSGMATAFVLARLFVFEHHDGRWHTAFVRFALVNLVSFLLVLAVSLMLADLIFPAIKWNWHRDDVAHMIGVASPILLSFYAHKHFSFANRAT